MEFSNNRNERLNQNIKLIEEILTEPENFSMLNKYLKESKFLMILEKLGIEASLDSIKEYISEKLNGKYKGSLAANKFLNCIKIYLNSNELKRVENGFIDFKALLPIKEENEIKGGLRRLGKYLGQDGLEYIAKQAEGFKGTVSGMKYKNEGIYNTTIANAFFEFCGEHATEAIPAIDTFPYVYVLCKNFLRDNQKTITLEKCCNNFTYDENGNVKHQEIIFALEEYVRNTLRNSMDNEQIESICKKIKLQYSIQETLKKLICSMDENLGNTSLIITNKKGKVTDIDVSPAYDLDLSFNLGQEILNVDKNGITGNIFYRTTENGKISFEEVVGEFIDKIPGYKEKISQIMNRFNEDYIKQIFEIAYQKTKIPDFKNSNFIQEYGVLLMNRIAMLKEIIKEHNQIKIKQNTK